MRRVLEVIGQGIGALFSVALFALGAWIGYQYYDRPRTWHEPVIADIKTKGGTYTLLRIVDLGNPHCWFGGGCVHYVRFYFSKRGTGDEEHLVVSETGLIYEPSNWGGPALEKHQIVWANCTDRSVKSIDVSEGALKAPDLASLAAVNVTPSQQKMFLKELCPP
jgi:hypothetical protein